MGAADSDLLVQPALGVAVKVGAGTASHGTLW